MQNNDVLNLPTETQIETIVNNRNGLFKHFRVAPCEYSRFFFFSILFGISTFIYSFMRILKDNYVMTRQDPICILYIKLFYITPLSFIIIIAINYMLSKRTVSKLFSIFSAAFMGIFIVLGFAVMLEKQTMFDTLPIEARLASYAIESRGLGFFKYLTLTVIEPLATCVYIVAELWGSLILSYLFLSYLNESCTEGQHSRFIPPLLIVANLSLLLSAMVTTLFLKLQDGLSNEQRTIFMGFIFFLEGFLVFCMLLCKYVLENHIITRPIFVAEKVKRSSAPKATPGFKESLRIMPKSRFLLGMCTAVCLYSVVANILETVHKNSIKKGADMQNIDRGKYSAKFSSYDQYITSISVILLNLSSFSKFVDTRGWLFVAMITPVIGLISAFCILGLGSYNAAVEDESINVMNAIFSGSKPLVVLENYLGAICLAALKVFKYTAFDVTKERISMRIESRYRPKFKSIYDGIFNKFGKSLGAVYGIVLTCLTTELDFRGLSPITSIVVLTLLMTWGFWTLYLSKAFNKSLKANEPIDIDMVESEVEEEVITEEKQVEKKLNVSEPAS